VLNARNMGRVCDEDGSDARASSPLLPNWEDDLTPEQEALLVCDRKVIEGIAPGRCAPSGDAVA